MREGSLGSQFIMDYWAETMQDDVFLIGSVGWMEAAKPRTVIENKDRNIRETPDLVVERKKYKMDLIPPALVVAGYFAAEQAHVDALEMKREAAERDLEEFVAENTAEEGLLDGAKNDKDVVTKASVSGRLAEIKNEQDNDEEKKTLERCLELLEVEAVATKAVREAQAELDGKVLKRYSTLSETEIKTLVVDDKWITSIRSLTDSEVGRLIQDLANRVKVLEERYAVPLPDIERELGRLSAKVEAHLKDMGVALV